MKKPLKIGFFYSHYYAKWPVTGGQYYEKDLIGALREMDGVDVECTFGKPGKSLLTKLLRPFQTLVDVLRKKKDLYIFNSSHCIYALPSVLILRLMGRKTIGIHHHFMHPDFKGVRRLIYGFFEPVFLHSVNRLIVPCPYVYDKMAQGSYKPEKMFEWQNYFNTEVYRDCAPVRGNLCFLGTIETRKGLVYLAKAMSLLKRRGVDCRLDVMGKVVEQDYYENLLKEIGDNGLDVTFHGFVDDEQMDAVMRRADLFTFPSLLEGFGRVLVEAQRYGLPIVSFDNSAMPYTVKQEENGLLVKDRDYEGFADAIERLLTDRGLRAQLSEGAYDCAANAYSLANFKSDIQKGLQSI